MTSPPHSSLSSARQFAPSPRPHRLFATLEHTVVAHRFLAGDAPFSVSLPKGFALAAQLNDARALVQCAEHLVASFLAAV
jgi:hypothetical protein